MEDGTIMVLDICGVQTIEQPTDKEIQSALSSLSMENEDFFAILGPSDKSYIQVAGDKSTGFELEYQDGSINMHYRATNGGITLDQAVAAFIAYRDGKSDWQSGFTFEKITWWL